MGCVSLSNGVLTGRVLPRETLQVGDDVGLDCVWIDNGVIPFF